MDEPRPRVGAAGKGRREQLLGGKAIGTRHRERGAEFQDLEGAPRVAGL
jgi:hypothetical protein